MIFKLLFTHKSHNNEYKFFLFVPYLLCSNASFIGHKHVSYNVCNWRQPTGGLRFRMLSSKLPTELGQTWSYDLKVEEDTFSLILPRVFFFVQISGISWSLKKQHLRRLLKRQLFTTSYPNWRTLIVCDNLRYKICM